MKYKLHFVEELLIPLTDLFYSGSADSGGCHDQAICNNTRGMKIPQCFFCDKVMSQK